MRKTKIICTLGPSTNSYDVLKEIKRIKKNPNKTIEHIN